jgi:ferredoxin-NADP reductase
MKVSVRGSIFDLLAFRGLPGKRKKRFANASARALPVHPVNQLAQQIHPPKLHLVVTEIREETGTTKTFKLAPAPDSETTALPHFRAGQYLSLKGTVDGARITRPYSISSAPCEASGRDGFYEITIRQVEGGFFSDHVLGSWRVDTPVQSSSPVGLFYHEPLRDSRKIVGLAGGSGVTPFRSMAREIIFGDLDAELLLLYGSSDEQDIVFYREFKELEGKSSGRVRVVHVLSCEQVSLEGCERGLITAELIERHADAENSSFFVCGPEMMYRFLEAELAKLGLPRRRVRREVWGELTEVASQPGFPSEAVGRTFRMKVKMDGVSSEIPAQATETLLVAMERAELAPPSLCRSGECAFCRSLLLGGDVFIAPESDDRRAADRKLGYIHPCASYPISDLELEAPGSPG